VCRAARQFATPPLYLVVCACVGCGVSGVVLVDDVCMTARQFATPPTYLVVCAWCVVCRVGFVVWGVVVMRV